MTPDHTLTAEDDEPDAPRPCVPALLAANVALMSAYASPAEDAKVDAATLRRLLARKVVSNLFFLREHPDLPPPLRQVMAQAHRQWAALAASLEGCVEPAWPARAGDVVH